MTIIAKASFHPKTPSLGPFTTYHTFNNPIMPVRGATFTPIEDKALAKSWIVASEYFIVGTKQKATAVLAKFKQCTTTSSNPETVI